MQFGGAVARALLIGVEIGGLDGMRVGSGSKMGKLQAKITLTTFARTRFRLGPQSIRAMMAC